MARPLTLSLPSDTLEAAIRFHFGLTQAELGRYLGISAGLVAHFEAGRRRAMPSAEQRLTWLAQLLPPPTGTGPAAAAFAAPAAPSQPAVATLLAALPTFGALPPAALQRRQRLVVAQAARLRWGLHRAGKADALQARRQWGLAILQAALPAETLAPAERAHLDYWLGVLAADVAAATAAPATQAARALAVVRLLMLDLEAAALARLLTAG